MSEENSKYSIQNTLRWIWRNKLIIFLSLLSFSLSISTWTLSSHGNNINSALQTCRSSLTEAVIAAATCAASATTESATNPISSEKSANTSPGPENTPSDEENDSYTVNEYFK
ncbi:unnamed protein product [Arctia plantaginis]|uniref:Uncharacterized protein n=1 Tax=Arctia plantaginis TaxID=874455 RepID=A0A8S1AYI6_ARCPL|nr:unnamed protein product [Arctia plantaginis]CAB3253829.1 unnamed protein product [Arctia plantaginis]